MSLTAASATDVMQVCRNGHVITDLLRNSPERRLTHCDRCGATTLDRCENAGQGQSLESGRTPYVNAFTSRRS